LELPIAELAERQHGVVSRRQLRDLGFVKSGIESRLRRGALHAIHRGVYAVGHRKLTIEGRWMAAVLASGPSAVLSHRSAGQLWRLVPRGSTAPEVTRPGTFRTRARIRAHHGTLPVDEIEEVDAIPVTLVARTILDLAAISGRQQVERAMNEAEVRGLTSRLSLPDLLRRYPRRRGSAVLRNLLGDDDALLSGVTKYELEVRFATFIDDHGLPRPRRNADLAVRGRFIEVDCLWPGQRLIVELDGRAVHGTRQAFEADRERDRLLLADGWRVTRITWRQLRDDAPALAADLKAMLAVGSLAGIGPTPRSPDEPRLP
jgi:Transcriptional regulator, AbiEi antitoxin/Protein of unknown function (DUF559)